MPAYLAPIESQCSTQLLDEIWLPHHSGCFPSERGFNASRKQPAAFHTPDLLLTEAGNCPDEDPPLEDDSLPVGTGLEGAVDDGLTGISIGEETAEVVCTTFPAVVAVAASTVEADDELFEEAMGGATGRPGERLPSAQFVGLVARPGPA